MGLGSTNPGQCLFWGSHRGCPGPWRLCGFGASCSATRMLSVSLASVSNHIVQRCAIIKHGAARAFTSAYARKGKTGEQLEKTRTCKVGQHYPVQVEHVKMKPRLLYCLLLSEPWVRRHLLDPHGKGVSRHLCCDPPTLAPAASTGSHARRRQPLLSHTGVQSCGS